MALVYGDEGPRGSFSGTPIHLWSSAAVMKSWQTHVANRYYLKFLYMRGSLGEKAQASKELAVCDRKIAFWERHAEFDKKLAGEVNAKLKAQWKL